MPLARTSENPQLRASETPRGSGAHCPPCSFRRHPRVRQLPLGRDPQIRFEVRSLALSTKETEYGTTFTREGALVAIGDPAAQRPYLVVLLATQLSGGDPELALDKEDMFTLPVRDGVARVVLAVGDRQKKTILGEAETWRPADYRVDVVGYIPVVTR